MGIITSVALSRRVIGDASRAGVHACRPGVPVLSLSLVLVSLFISSE